jgi:hypothetical protein
MAKVLEVSEAKTAYVLSCLIEGKYMGKEDDAAEAAAVPNGDQLGAAK